ncbi:hypothetical protein [Helicobacter sp.]|uniref:hypothetical protein n=1 Tax=Helicobacter sp. TaxID=218 RepID=UPI0025BBF3F0|nr:hypothetical protein [Helicobacter sp.]MCI5969147.1 hypothetical protein [Helicobacter sp.]
MQTMELNKEKIKKDFFTISNMCISLKIERGLIHYVLKKGFKSAEEIRPDSKAKEVFLVLKNGGYIKKRSKNAK